MQTKAPLDHETKDTYTVTVTATDPSGESDTISVTTILKIGGSGGLEGDLVAQTFQAAHRPASESCPVPLRKVVVPQVHEMLPVLDHAVDDYGDAVGHGHRRPLGPDAPGQPPVLGPQVGLGPSTGPPPPRPVSANGCLCGWEPVGAGPRSVCSPDIPQPTTPDGREWEPASCPCPLPPR